MVAVVVSQKLEKVMKGTMFAFSTFLKLGELIRTLGELRCSMARIITAVYFGSEVMKSPLKI